MRSLRPVCLDLYRWASDWGHPGSCLSGWVSPLQCRRHQQSPESLPPSVSFDEAFAEIVKKASDENTASWRDDRYIGGGEIGAWALADDHLGD